MITEKEIALFKKSLQKFKKKKSNFCLLLWVELYPLKGYVEVLIPRAPEYDVI